MKREHRDRWCDALVSGAYKQGYLYLRDAKDEYCPIGVLVQVVKGDKAWDKWPNHPAYWMKGGSHFFVSHKFLDEVGLNPGLASAIMQLNDGNTDKMQTHRSFDEIADWIRIHVPVDEDQPSLL